MQCAGRLGSIWKLAQSPEQGQQWQQARRGGCEGIPGKAVRTQGLSGCLQGTDNSKVTGTMRPEEQSNLGLK